MKESYKTKQREEILAFFRQNPGRHLTAGQLCDALEGVSKATVYRLLDRLVQEGVLRRYNLNGGQAACYQYSGSHTHCREHYHMKCLECGRLFHVECPAMNRVAGELKEREGFWLDSSMTVLYGLCRECRLRQSPPKNAPEAGGENPDLSPKKEKI